MPNIVLVLLFADDDGIDDADAPPPDYDEAADAKASARPIDASNTVKRSTKIPIMCAAYFFKNKLTSNGGLYCSHSSYFSCILGPRVLVK